MAAATGQLGRKASWGAVALLGGFGLVGADVWLQGLLYQADRRVLEQVEAVGPVGLRAWWAMVTQLGDARAVVVPVAALVAVTLVVMRRWVYAAGWLAGLLGSVGIVSGLKAVWGRERPWDYAYFQMTPGFTFPSGHTVGAVITYGLLAYLLGRMVGWPRLRTTLLALAGVLMVAVGVGLVMIRVHYPTDVLAAWAIGGAWLLGVIAGVEWVENRLRPPLRPPLAPPAAPADAREEAPARAG